MSEEKFASLTSGLLARKGGAKPAMRRQGYINPADLPGAHEHHEDLGWNDMGFDGPHPIDEATLNGGHDGAFGGMPAVRIQQEELAQDLGAPVEDDEESAIDIQPHEPEALSVVAPEDAVLVPFAPPAASRKPHREPAADTVRARDKAAFTLRLDKDRHLKLRLAAAVSHRSAQNIVTEALDIFLAAMPELDGLADRLPMGKAGTRH